MDSQLSHSLFGSSVAGLSGHLSAGSDQDEKRFRQRVRLALQVKGRVVSGGLKGPSFKSVTQDVTFHGLQIKVPRHKGYEREQVVKLKIRLYRGDFFLRAIGKICWVGRHAGNGPRLPMGIQITKMRRFNAWCERINQCMCHHMNENRNGGQDA